MASHAATSGTILAGAGRIVAALALPLLAFTGVLSNAVGKVAGVNAGTLLLFGLVFACAATGAALLVPRRRGGVPRGLVTLLGLLGGGALLAGYYTAFHTTNALVSAKASLSYFGIPCAALLFYALPGFPGAARATERGLLALTGLLCAFGLAQFFAGFDGPQALLVLRGEPVLGFPDQDWVRPTALVGNTILYAGTIYLLLMIHWSAYLLCGARRHAVMAFACILLLYLAMSRYALVAGLASMVVVTAVAAFGARPKKAVTVRRGVLLVLLAFTAGALLTGGKLVVARFTATDEASHRSTEVHIQEKGRALTQILVEDARGGWGTQGIASTSSIVSDGLWFQLGVEVGIPGTLTFVVWLAALAALAVLALRSVGGSVAGVLRLLHPDTVDRRLFALLVPLLGYLSYAFLGGFINTSFAGRVSYFVFWALVGTFLGMVDERARGGATAVSAASPANATPRMESPTH